MGSVPIKSQMFVYLDINYYLSVLGPDTINPLLLLKTLLMKNKTFKQSTSLYLRLIFFLFFLVVNCTIYKSFSQQTGGYILRMEGRMSVNGNDIRMFHNKMYLFGNYLLEPVNNLTIKSYNKIDKNGQAIPEPESTTIYMDSIVKYIFTDITLKQSTEFNLYDTPEVINAYPLAQKKPGISISCFSNFELFPQLVKEMSNFYFVNDTTINGFKYKIMEDTTIRANMNNINIKRAKIYINQNLPNFPIHPMSTNLDKKFNGICSRIVLYDTGNTIYISEWLINKETDSKIHNLLDKYLAICNHLKK